MNAAIEILMVLSFLTNMAVLGLSRIRTCIRMVAFQGIVLGCFTYMAEMNDVSLRIMFIAVVSLVIKGLVFPALLLRATRETGFRRENAPFVGYSMSLLAGLAMMGISLWLSARLPVEVHADIPLAVPAAMMSMLTGLFLIVARKNALTQCLGYIILENGIYIVGIVSVVKIPALVELGILLDVFVAVLIMGIAIYNISREFEHIDADRLNILKG